MRRTAVWGACLGVVVATRVAWSATYYVDDVAGLDSNVGTSEVTAWRSLAAVNGRTFLPGDRVLFRRGGYWQGTSGGSLRVSSSGSSGAPITFSAYGTGPSPVIGSSGAAWTRSVLVTGSWVVVEQIEAIEANEFGILVDEAASHVTVQDCAVRDVGIGIGVRGTHSLITRNHVHDLRMVVNDAAPDNDYGAVGIWVYASDNEISHNRLERCQAPSIDYGSDGGGIEIFARSSDANRISVHHNHAFLTNGFMEVGGKTGFGYQVHDVTLAYNVLEDVQSHFGPALSFHNNPSGGFGIDLENFRVHNNTIVLRRPPAAAALLTTFVYLPAPAGPTDIVFQNNLIHIDHYDKLMTGATNITHDHNLIFRADPAECGLGFTASPTDLIDVDPAFASLPAYGVPADLHLTAPSPAIDAGAVLGYSEDFAGVAVPLGAAPEIGAFEYGGAQTCAELGGTTCCGSGAVCPSGGFGAASDCPGTCCPEACVAPVDAAPIADGPPSDGARGDEDGAPLDGAGAGDASMTADGSTGPDAAADGGPGARDRPGECGCAASTPRRTRGALLGVLASLCALLAVRARRGS